MSEAWYKSYCPKCESINWICNGDESDLSGVDIEAYKCWKCGHIECLGGEDQWESLKAVEQIDNKEDCYWELGKETPN